MKKQIKKTGFHEMCEIISKNNLTLNEYKDLLELSEGKLPSYRVAMKWVGDNMTPSEELKKLVAEINGLFKPVKKEVKSITLEQATEFNNIFPNITLGSGKRARCNPKEIISAFEWFFKNYPEHFDWNVILQATVLYVSEQAGDNFKFTRRCKYYVRKMMQDKSWESDLEEYYNRVINDDNLETFVFPEKVV